MNSKFAEEMLDDIESIEDIFQEYVLIKNSETCPIVHCFFEGKDDYKYYISRIKKYTKEEIINHDCNGRDNVTTIHAMISNQTKSVDNNKTLFFIDKDFKLNSIESKEIYKTPVYAIENFYITDSAINEFIKAQMGISKFSKSSIDKNDYENVISYYKDKRDEFIKDITLLNTWYSIQIKRSEYLDSNEPELSKIKKLTKKFNIPITLEMLKERTDNYVEVTEEELKTEEKELLENPIANFRGKYYASFLHKVIDKIIEESNNPKLFLSKKRKIKLSIGAENVVDILSQYADTPICLDLYLQKRLLETDEISEKVAN